MPKLNTFKLNIWKHFNDHWKGIVVGVCTGFTVMAIIFSLPLIPIINESMLTEYTTEMKQESYAVNEPYVTSEVSEKVIVIASGFYRVVPNGVEIPFTIDEAGSRLVGQFDNTIPGSFVVFDIANHIVWEMLGSRGTIDLPLQTGQYRLRFRENLMWGEDCYLDLAIKWTKVEQVTRYQEVIRYKWILVHVPKYTTIVKEERISVWKHLFG